jgi:diguanylate cyclase (GGDEF)-like protein/PAS domain S-box-containing protein
MLKTFELLDVSIPGHLQDWMLRRLLRAHNAAIPIVIFGQLLFAGLLVAGEWVTSSIAQSILFLAGVGIASLHRTILGMRISNLTDDDSIHRIHTELLINSIGYGLLFGSAFYILLPAVVGMNQMMLCIIAMALIGTSSHSLRTIPKAGIAYMTLVTIGIGAGLFEIGRLSSLVSIAVLIAATAFLVRMLATSYRLFVSRALREREAQASTETVKLLLNDYQEQGADWLFELSEAGTILNANERFSNAIGLPQSALNGRQFSTLFLAGEEQTRLRANLDAAQAFRQLSLPLSHSVAGDMKWWSISCRPVEPTYAGAAHFRGVISDISSEKRAEARVRHLAHYDSLTGLPNRMMFQTGIDRGLEHLGASTRVALMYIDVDQFKQVNDMYGHLAGDEFLKQVSARLEKTVSSSGMGGEGRMVARLGGDEFAIMLVGDDVGEKAIRLAQILVDELHKPFFVDGHELNSSISVGLSLAPDHAGSSAALQSNADIALYVAKDGGRNRWEMFEPGMDVALQQRHAIEKDLRTALLGDEFRLYLQPLVDVETSTQVGFEALLRWEHPTKGMIMPLDFIPIAEDSGLIVPIGEWVLRTAIAEAASWAEPMAIAINLSPIQLRSPNLLPVIINALADTGLDPSRVELEITETVLMQNCEENITVLNRLHDLGVKIALDDFGTGYASLNYLRTFPFDKIKIDRSFVNDLELNDDCRAIVGAVISLANELGMCTLAEGVEQESQLIKLREQGCGMVQGWLFGKAMPASHYALGASKDLETRRVA